MFPGPSGPFLMNLGDFGTLKEAILALWFWRSDLVQAKWLSDLIRIRGPQFESRQEQDFYSIVMPSYKKDDAVECR